MYKFFYNNNNNNVNFFYPGGELTMKYGELNNIFSAIIGVSIILICCFITYLSQKYLFTKKYK